MKRRPRLIVFALTVIAIFTMIGFFADDLSRNMTLGLDLQGGFEIVYEVSPLESDSELPSMAAVARSISKRIDVLGVNEPEIHIEGDNRIRVQLAGVSDQEQARRVISATANLTFRDVNDNLLADATILREGGASLGFENGIPVVSLKIADQDAFFELTKKVSEMTAGNNMIVTWLDYEDGDKYADEKGKEATGNQKYISAASVTQGIRGDAIIKGSFSEAEARELSDLINSGSLPVRMSEISSNVVSAEFGEAAFRQTMIAGAIGVFLVMAFMIFIYKIPGIIATIMLAFYILTVFFIFESMGGVFTLPGIAALVLGVGMTVDANILSFERIRDELYEGRSLPKAFKEGNNLAFWTIFDAQLTTFIAALVMYVFGTGSIRGFATMLMVTVFVTMVINLGLTRFLLSQIVKSGIVKDNVKLFGVKQHYVPNVSKGENRTYFGPFTNIDFIGIAKPFMMASAGIIGLAVLLFGFNALRGEGGLNLGIDFSSGTKVTVVSDIPLTLDELRADFAQFSYDSVKVQFVGERQVYVTTTETETSENLTGLKAFILEKYGNPANEIVVTPIIGRELVRSAALLSLVAWLLMMVYITIRFEWDYALGTIAALLHDILMVLAFFAIFRIEVNTELIAVLLAIIGYSVDDSIVVFSRIREGITAYGQRAVPKQAIRGIVNAAMAQTLIRSAFSSLTTLLPILALLSFGSREIFTFNFAMVVGLVAGAYSSIFIAVQLWYYLRVHRKPKVRKQRARKSNEPAEMVISGIND